MKEKFLLIISLITLFGCNNRERINDRSKRNDNWCWFVDSKSGKGFWIPIGQDNPPQNGKYTLFFSKGEVHEKGKILKGVKIDTTYYYNPHGELIKYSFKKGDSTISKFPVNGIHKMSRPNYSLSEIGKVKNNERNGTWSTYFKSGKLERKATFADGKLHGNYEAWSEKGILIENSNWKNGALHGLFKSYHENGSIKEKSLWIEGKRNGLTYTWYENGKLKSKRPCINDLYEGPVKMWYSSGTLKYIITYKSGIENGHFEFYHENGKLYQSGTFVNDKPQGLLKFYDKKGKLFEIDTYENGELVDVNEL